jgi:hypothetical protein
VCLKSTLEENIGRSFAGEFPSAVDRPRFCFVSRRCERGSPLITSTARVGELLPRDDIVFPHAIKAALSRLKQNLTHVAAHGYSLRFGLERGDRDIHQVEHFIPTIGDADPRWRYALLMQRCSAISRISGRYFAPRCTPRR